MVTRKANPVRTPGITLGLTLLFAFVGGVGVGNLYWAQPLLGEIAADLNVAPGTAGLLVTLAQIGYALGVFFVVPLGDTMHRKRLIPAIMICCSLSLAGCVLAPSFALLLSTLALVGFTNVAGQMLLPLAGDLATDEQRGRVLGTVASGLLSGILLSRLVSGIVADVFGWRMIYVLASGTILVLAVILWRAIPVLKPRERLPYGRLLFSVVQVTFRHRRARVIPLFGASLMCVFTAFWTGLTLLLSAPLFSLPASHIGLVSLFGVLGVIGAQFTGRVYERGWAVPAIGIGLVLTLAAVALAGFCGSSIVAVLTAISLLSVGTQSVLVLLQTMMVSIDPAARSRLNTAHIVSNFIGGALGSTLAAVLWHVGQWTAVMACSALVLVFALTLWLFQRKRALAAGAPFSGTGGPAADISPKQQNAESRCQFPIASRLD
ncbi:MFS transporter [Arthrobacter sp. BE255]|uniref:MFS transporter n=1 Tax=Arthrobacter sp. BE255 TaxID=2817721 RepID=UPI002857D693|nr:MFS transporter [Arthrobacter sp. BE255]MDR7161941.1 putative MFS family arabinose efflux permease [Arthrobacter sp. BE255]